MITVQILINGQVLYARSARNTGRYGDSKVYQESGNHLYDVDTGDVIGHNIEDSVVALAHKLLDTVEEV